MGIISKTKFGIIFICILFFLSTSILSVEEDFPEISTTSEEQFKIDIKKHPQTATENDMAKYDDVTKDNWDRFSDNQKDDLYEDHMHKFEDEFSEYWHEKRGLYINPRNGQYNKYHKSITYPDGTEIYLDTMQGNSIEPVPFGVMIDGIKYTNAQKVTGSAGYEDETAGDQDNAVSFESADLVSTDNVQFISPLNSTITSDYESITITTTEEISVVDSGWAEVIITPIDEGTVTMGKTTPYYEISSAEISYMDETFVANNTATLTIDKDTGFGCIEIEPQGTYYKNYGDIRKDFAIHAYQESYKLCFRKYVGDAYVIPTSEDNYGVVDFVDKKMYLNGMIQYLRYPFAETITSANFRNVYDGQKADSKSKIELDADELEITGINIQESTGMISVSNPAEYITIVEEDMTTWVNLSHKDIDSTNVAQHYISAVLITNMLKTGMHEIYPYSGTFIGNYIQDLNKEENMIYGII